MWEMTRQGREVRSRTDYILGFDRRIFQNVAVWDLGHNSDHYMVMGCLRGASSKEHSNYLRRRKCPPHFPPELQTRTWEDKIFADLRRAVLNP